MSTGAHSSYVPYHGVKYPALQVADACITRELLLRAEHARTRLPVRRPYTKCIRVVPFVANSLCSYGADFIPTSYLGYG